VRSSQHIHSFSLQVQIPNIQSGFQHSHTIGLNVWWMEATIDGLQ